MGWRWHFIAFGDSAVTETHEEHALPALWHSEIRSLKHEHLDLVAAAQAIQDHFFDVRSELLRGQSRYILKNERLRLNCQNSPSKLWDHISDIRSTSPPPGMTEGLTGRASMKNVNLTSVRLPVDPRHIPVVTGMNLPIRAGCFQDSSGLGQDVEGRHMAKPCPIKSEIQSPSATE
nr:hypothetical protein [Microvirga roseola]